MPTLDLAALQALREKPARWCHHCQRAVNPNYCRRCDKYFEAGHLPLNTLPVSQQREGWRGPACAEHAVHDEHRTY